jgi:hypothetical protein
MNADEDRVERLRARDPAESDANPYEDVDFSKLPSWWQRAIEEFEEAGLRPYRPPRFADGEYKHEVVEELEGAHGVDIEFVGIGVNYGDDWRIRVDGNVVAPVGHRRSTDGYSVFEISSDDFRSLIRNHVESD